MHASDSIWYYNVVLTKEAFRKKSHPILDWFQCKEIKISYTNLEYTILGQRMTLNSYCFSHKSIERKNSLKDVLYARLLKQQRKKGLRTLRISRNQWFLFNIS